MKNNSIPPKSNNSKIAKNGEVRPFSLNNKYKTKSTPNKNPRRAFKIKLNRENIKKKRSINPGTKIEN
jgi:hypothetical protein